jgi:glycosyltransferase involved in cell wall biosynthesis
MLFSIVLRTKNEIKNIEKFYKSVLHQKYKNYELIVVDNFSTDGTFEYCKEKRIAIYQKGPERIAQGNYGMLKKAKGDIVGYFDADMILSPNLLLSAKKTFEKSSSDVIALHIPEIILGKSYWCQVRRFERSFYNNSLIDAARFIKRNALIKVGGFDEENFKTASAEDWDLDKRLKKLGVIAPLKEIKTYKNEWNKELFEIINRNLEEKYKYSSGFFHDEREFSIFWYLKKKKYYANSIENYKIKWGKDDSDIKKQLGIKYRFFDIFFKKKKYVQVLKNPLKFASMYALIFMVSLMYLLKKIRLNIY